MFHVNQADLAHPAPDCETAMLLRSFLLPSVEAEGSWADLSDCPGGMGHDIAFREGHLVLAAEDGIPLFNGGALGMPLREIACRIGRPSMRASLDGQQGALR